MPADQSLFVISPGSRRLPRCTRRAWRAWTTSKLVTSHYHHVLYMFIHPYSSHIYTIDQFHEKVNEKFQEKIVFYQLVHVVPLLTGIGTGSTLVPTLGLRSIKTVSLVWLGIALFSNFQLWYYLILFLKKFTF